MVRYGWSRLSVIRVVMCTVLIISSYYLRQYTSNGGIHSEFIAPLVDVKRISYGERKSSGTKIPSTKIIDHGPPVGFDYQSFVSNHGKVSRKSTKIWVSIGLCFSGNTKMYGKQKYPYAEVTPLSILLWKHFAPETTILLYLVYNDKDLEERRRRYEAMLLQFGNVKVRWVKADDMACVMKSQIIRMWGFSDPLVKPQDLVLTVDCNAFIMTQTILDPIFSNPDKLIWVYLWKSKPKFQSKSTFGQSFIVAYAAVWRQMMEPEFAGPNRELNQRWINQKYKSFGNNTMIRGNKWFADQWITSIAILKEKLCSLPANAGLWQVPILKETPGLGYDPNFNDSTTCWHGKDLETCDKKRRMVGEGCKWWHFFPHQSLKEHIAKFTEISGSNFNISFIGMFDEW